ncbi:hypothetical protein Ddye_008543 [Dipteronia dyeriana]|uniref:Uncharacterized protein n=1 Tax=Dipteronia dyeriana TaxID=168575 RepID=A0AAD9XA63_9ROSI|nr:hypothetical protein Ddye_008543 [Dipteronia dyeriana]
MVRGEVINTRCSMVTIRDSDCSSIFPPINHENLHIQEEERKHRNPSSISKEVIISGWLGFGRTKICNLLVNNGAIRALFGSAAGVAVFVIWWWLRHRRCQRESADYLKLIIKQKDEKITQLLHQIAQMNQVFVARHMVLASKLPN